MKVVSIDSHGNSSAAAMLHEALARCERDKWMTVVILGYTAGKIEIVASAHKSTDMIVGALERAKWELLDGTWTEKE